MQAWEEKYYEREEGREEGSKFKLNKIATRWPAKAVA